MDIEKLARSLRAVGGLTVLGSIVWWYVFYSDVISGTDANLIEALPCLAITSGECGLISGLVSLGGGTAYTPLVFWTGIVIVVLAVVIGVSAKKEI